MTTTNTMTTTGTIKKHYYIEDIQNACPKFFSPSSMRFFNSRVHEQTYTDGKLWYFTTSEKYA